MREPAVIFLLAIFTLTTSAALRAQQILDPRMPETVAAHLRNQGFRCPTVTELQLEGQTNRGNLYRVGCRPPAGPVSWWYQMILSPDESHASFYPCVGAERCPVRLR